MSIMQVSTLAIVLLCFSAHAVGAAEVKVTPVQKVIQLMNGMLEKAKKEKDEEKAQFTAYTQFCEDTQTEKKRRIAEADERIDVLTADIQQNTADAAQLTKDIAELDEDISIWNGDIKAATSVREIEKKDYDTTHADYTESIDALGRAIKVLKKQTGDTAQAPEPESFIQVASLNSLNFIPAEAKRTIDNFLQNYEEGLAVAAPEASGYEFQSSGVVEMLEKLLDKFTDEQTALEKQEMNSKHEFDMLMQDLNAQIEQSTGDRDQKAKDKAGHLQAKADAEGDSKQTAATRDADAKYLADVTATCEEKASAFESRQQLRAEEIEAVEKAIEIISSGAVSGSADKHLPALLQVKTSLAQLRSDSSTQSKVRVAAFLKKQAKKLNSRILAAVAQKVEGEDVFAKIKKMVKDLIARLLKEAAEEAEQKAFCDKELSTNEQTRKEKTATVETIHAQIDELNASIAKLTEEINDLNAAVAELEAKMQEATELRTAEKAKNTETISDAGAAQAAVAQALTVLKDFYAKAGEATSFVQEPEIFDEAYKGMGGESGGVVGMLEVIESDFARLEADTKSAEATAQKEYDTFMADSKADKEQKNAAIEQKTAKLQDENQALTVASEDLSATQNELDAALKYYDKLKPTCMPPPESYDQRVKKRKEEIASLQEALATIEDIKLG